MLVNPLSVLQLSALATIATMIYSQFPPNWRKSCEPVNILISISLICYTRAGEKPAAINAGELNGWKANRFICPMSVRGR